MKKPDFFKKAFAVAVFTSVTMLFAGCGSIIKIAEFPIVSATTPTVGTNVSYSVYLSTLKSTEAPVYVEKPTRPDKTLYNPMFFASVDSFTKTNVLVKNSYFTYDLLTKTDWTALDKLTEPTNININLYADSGRSDLKLLESAFIYKIEEDYIYLGTAGHCISSKKYLKNATIMFYDRKTVKVDLSTYELGGKFNSKEGDYAMYRIPTSDIPYEELIKLKQVTYSEDAVEKVKVGDTIYSGNIYTKNTKKDYDKKLTVIGKGDDTYDHFAQYDSYKVITYDTYFITEGSLVKGQSGSAMFDKYGNAVGTVSGHGTHDTKAKNYRIGIFTKLYDINTLYKKLKDK